MVGLKYNNMSGDLHLEDETIYPNVKVMKYTKIYLMIYDNKKLLYEEQKYTYY